MANEEWGLIPERMRGGIMRYIDHGIEPGHFLTAVICNDLYEAAGRADGENRRLLFEYTYFFYNYAPSGCYGSKEKFLKWVSHKGLSGQGSGK